MGTNRRRTIRKHKKKNTKWHFHYLLNGPSYWQCINEVFEQDKNLCSKLWEEYRDFIMNWWLSNSLEPLFDGYPRPELNQDERDWFNPTSGSHFKTINSN